MADQHYPRRNETMVPSRDEVARRAYELFEARGAEPGHDLDNWLDAERELSRTTTSEVDEPSREPRHEQEP